jgi:hypothetical protein
MFKRKKTRGKAPEKRGRRLALEVLERREVLSGAWHHAWLPADVTADRVVAPLDALTLINDLNAHGSRLLPVPTLPLQPPPYLDPTDDGMVSADDVLFVVNELNHQSPLAGEPFQAHFDFGTAASPPATGFTPVEETTQYSADLGYGWHAGSVRSVDRGTSESLTRDFHATSDGTFVVDLPRGTYRVDLLFGDRGTVSHGEVNIYLEGGLRDAVSTAAGQVVARAYRVTVDDGQLTLRLRDVLGAGNEACVTALRVTTEGAVRPAASDAWWPMFPEIPGATFSAPTRDANGFDVYRLKSQYQKSETIIRVLLPDGYQADREYPVVYVLPVEAGSGTQYGDGLLTVKNAGLHAQYAAIFVSPTFSDLPWYADHATDSTIWQETYFRSTVVPLIEARYSVIGTAEGRLLLGFSKSGWGAHSMLLRHPDEFGRAFAFDSPLSLDTPYFFGYNEILGSTANFENYRASNNLPLRAAELRTQPARLFMLGFGTLQYELDEADREMNQLGIPHVYDRGTRRDHVWHSGWINRAVAMLFS